MRSDAGLPVSRALINGLIETKRELNSIRWMVKMH